MTGASALRPRSETVETTSLSDGAGALTAGSGHSSETVSAVSPT